MTRFSDSRLALPPGARDTIEQWTAPLRARWQSLGARERRGLTVAGWVLGLFVAWALAIAPAWRTAREAPTQLDRLDAQLQQMQRLAGEARELRSAPVIGGTQAVGILRAATGALGTAGRLQVAGDRATLTLNGANGGQLRDWLTEARSSARARPLEANLTRGPQGFSGSIVVALPAGGGAP